MSLFLQLLILCQNGFIPSVLSIQDSYTAAVKSAIEVKTLLCIGDSITKGDGSSDPFYNYPSQLSRLLNGDTSHNGVQFDVINLGISFICLLIRSILLLIHYYCRCRIKRCNNAENS